MRKAPHSSPACSWRSAWRTPLLRPVTHARWAWGKRSWLCWTRSTPSTARSVFQSTFRRLCGANGVCVSVQKVCAQVLPTIFIDVHNACITNKLRDFLYVLLNHPDPQCRERPRLVVLKRKIQNLYSIITRLCYRDLVFFTDDCEGIDTGHSKPYGGEDRLQLLQEEEP
uniref:Cytokine like 1 n=1 Tax=Neogobius melanostomus TaxID=47308 RepID=A0A8C6U7H1_9GOBI